MLILFTLKDTDTLQHPALYNALIKAPKIGLPAASLVGWLAPAAFASMPNTLRNNKPCVSAVRA